MFNKFHSNISCFDSMVYKRSLKKTDWVFKTVLLKESKEDIKWSKVITATTQRYVFITNE